ncbi:MAG: hypothetical protein M1832_005364 [Thelocarpon impressellum]|nr:MAG: hypothetical protein M1832_005364 [Thelocarpon impressellum]
MTRNGLRLLGGHMALWLAGTSMDGPLQLEYVRSAELAVRVYDWNVANANESIAADGPPGSSRYIFPLGKTPWTNTDMANPLTGKGIVPEVYRANPSYESGTHSGMHFVRDLSRGMGFKPSKGFERLFRLLEAYEQQASPLRQSNLPLLLEAVGTWGDATTNSRILWELAGNQTVPAVKSSAVNATDSSTFYPDVSEPWDFLVRLRHPLPQPWDQISTPDKSRLLRRARSNSDISPVTKKPYFYLHSIVHVEGVPDSRVNVPLESELKLWSQRKALAFQVREEAPIFARTPVQPPYSSDGFFECGTTAATNDEIFDAVERATAQMRMYVGGVVDCNKWARISVARLQGQIPSELQALMTESNKYLQMYAGNDPYRGWPLAVLTRDRPAGEGWIRTEIDVSNPRLHRVLPNDLKLDKFFTVKGSTPRPNPGLAGGTARPLDRPGGGGSGSSGVPASQPDALIGSPRAGGSRAQLCNRRRGLSQRSSCMAMVAEEAEEMPFKSKGIAKLLGRVFSADMVKAGTKLFGEIATGAMVVTILVDLANGDYKGAAIAVASMAAGAVAEAVVEALGAEALVGIIVGGLVALVVDLILNAPSTPPNLPDIKSATQIIQYTMFRDPKVTGNEKCREGTAEQPARPNCTALYGSGVIANAFKWSQYEAVVFMIHAKPPGYAMTIQEMADAFHVKQRDEPASVSEDKVATITCAGNDLNLCPEPVYELKLHLITIPNLGQTADVTLSRLVSPSGGDCILVTDVGEYNYAAYNLRVTGMPVAISCNTSSVRTDVFPGLGINGMTLESGANSTATALGNATSTAGPAAPSFATNSSSDGLRHSVVAPYPPLGFAPALNASNALCMSGPGGSQCFPSGVYQTQSGKLGFNSSQANALTMPAGSWLSWRRNEHGNGEGIVYNQTTNATADQPEFARDMQLQALDATDKTFEVRVSTPDPPMLCLFTERKWLGDAACYGVGSGNVSDEMRDQAQSVASHGGAQFWLYGRAYGDAGGVQYSMPIADLASVPNGGYDFNKTVKAIWVVEPQKL